MTVYLSGRITGKEDYAASFSYWSGICERQGIEAADAILMLPDWMKSKGANIEKLYAEYIGKKVLYAKHKIVTEERVPGFPYEFTIPEITETADE